MVARKEAKHWVWQLPAPAEPGDACERPTPNEDGQEEMAKALRDAWPPCNSVKAQDSDVTAPEDGHTGVYGHLPPSNENGATDAEPF